jgi:hypothetical protein
MSFEILKRINVGFFNEADYLFASGYHRKLQIETVSILYLRHKDGNTEKTAKGGAL